MTDAQAPDGHFFYVYIENQNAKSLASNMGPIASQHDKQTKKKSNVNKKMRLQLRVRPYFSQCLSPGN